jgi:hypothetical protein
MKDKIAIVLCVLLSLSSAAYSQDTNQAPATREDVVKMLTALHTKETMQTVMAAVAAQAKAATRKSLKQAHPEAKEEDLAEGDRLMDQVISDLPMDEMIESMIPIYQKHFTRQDMNSIVAFYDSPTGQKFIREMPAMVQESMQANMAIVERKMQASQKKVEDMVNKMIEKNRKSGERAPKADKS